MELEMFEIELSKLNIALTEKQKIQLAKYHELIVEYNKVMNLTGITERNDVYLKHFYDSLTIVKVIDLKEEETLCDMGTGAGLPGIVLKIVFPNLKVTLVDSLNKRIEFLKIVIAELGLEEIEAIHARLEEYGINNREKYDVVTARAVAPMSMLLEFAAPLLNVGKYFVAMKGNIDESEKYDDAIRELKLKKVSVEKFTMPVEESHRTLIKVIKESKTPKNFPRKFAEIKKRPL